MKPLTAPQQFVVDHMKNGWELAHSGGWYASDWLQKGKIGYGGPTKSVHAKTASALHRMGALKVVRELDYGGQVFHLSKKGERL